MSESKITPSEAGLSSRQLAFFEGLAQNRAHSTVLSVLEPLLKTGGISRAELAKKINREPSQVTRWLSSPENWTLQTLGILLGGLGYVPIITAQPINERVCVKIAEAALIRRGKEMTQADEAIERLRLRTENYKVRTALSQEELEQFWSDIRTLLAEVERLQEAGGWLWDTWAATEDPGPGVFHASANFEEQTKEYMCVGCNAVAISRWPKWELTFRHEADCKVEFARAALQPQKVK